MSLQFIGIKFNVIAIHDRKNDIYLYFHLSLQYVRLKK